MKKINYELIHERMTELCDSYIGSGLFIGKYDIYFDFNTDNECYISVSNRNLMEDEDEILEEAKAVFKELGIVADFEWDYDAGDEYSQVCMLDITIKEVKLSKEEKFALIDEFEKMAYDEDLAYEDLEVLGNCLRNLRLAIEFQGGDISEDEFLDCYRSD